MPEHKRTVLVTGGGQGLGEATVRLFASRGWQCVVLDAVPEPALALQGDLSPEAVPLVISCDVADSAAVDRSMRTVLEEFGSVECLVNNAGVSVKARGDLLDVSQDSFDRCFDVNTRGTFFFTQAVAKRMASAEPPADVHRSIVFVTSSNAVMASVERGEYCMSKTALSMAVKLFAIRMARHRVGVYEIQPGLIMTEMTKPSKAKYDALIDEGMLIERRWGQPEDVARTVRSMAAGLLPYTAAQEVRVDGGLMLGRF